MCQYLSFQIGTVYGTIGDPIPKPSKVLNYSGQWRIRVPKHLHAELALQAKEEGVSLNMLAATLLAEGIGKKLCIHQNK